MISAQDRHRVGQARLLRRQGKTYDEIRAILGPVHNEELARWLKGIRRPPETRRGKAQDDVRRRCRRLRADGLTYDEISARTGASKGSLSLWLHDLPQDIERARAHRLDAVRATCEQTRAQKAAARSELISSVADEVGAITDRELLLVGAALYWAEGGKSKPWRQDDRLAFINSDPSMILVFLRWLAMLGVDKDRCGFRVSIHESADVCAAETYWADVVGVGVERLNRTTIKRHNPKTVRLNTGDSYHGCLTINVRRSAELYRFVEGWWAGMTRSVVEAG